MAMIMFQITMGTSRLTHQNLFFTAQTKAWHLHHLMGLVSDKASTLWAADLEVIPAFTMGHFPSQVIPVTYN